MVRVRRRGMGLGPGRRTGTDGLTARTAEGGGGPTTGESPPAPAPEPASDAVAARNRWSGRSSILPAGRRWLTAEITTWASIPAVLPSSPRYPSQNGAQATNGRKIASLLSLTRAAFRFALSDTGCLSLQQRPSPVANKLPGRSSIRLESQKSPKRHPCHRPWPGRKTVLTESGKYIVSPPTGSITFGAVLWSEGRCPATRRPGQGPI